MAEEGCHQHRRGAHRLEAGVEHLNETMPAGVVSVCSAGVVDRCLTSFLLSAQAGFSLAEERR
jgi:hypothetical protein